MTLSPVRSGRRVMFAGNRQFVPAIASLLVIASLLAACGRVALPAPQATSASSSDNQTSSQPAVQSPAQSERDVRPLIACALLTKSDTVAGVGDGAVWDSSTKQLTLFKGAYLLVVTMTGPKLDANGALESAKTMVGKVLANLAA